MNIEITSAEAGLTIREYLRRRLGYSSAMLKKLKFTDGGIKINGNFVTVRHVLEVGELLSLMCEDTREDVSPYIIPVDLPLDVLYEDEHVTVVDKPPLMPAHPSFGHRDDTVANALAYRYRNSTYVFRPVNRLDRDTSGVMLCANTRLASYKMYRSMREGMISKYYIAILKNTPAAPSGEIRSYMRRKDGSVIMREECAKDEGKLAVTRYTVLCGSGDGCAVIASPITGRTHQLRVQFAGIGCPIIGDSLYGDMSCHISRQALHAISSAFPHPSTSEWVTFVSPLPDDIKKLCDAVGLDAETIIDEAMKIISSGENERENHT